MPSLAVFTLLFTSPLCVLSHEVQFKLLLVTVGITAVLPMAGIAILHHWGAVLDRRLVVRSDRVWPLAMGVLFFLCAVAYMAYQHQPRWVVMFFAGAALACFISLVVTRWWKISLHAAGVAAYLAMLCALRVMNLEVVSPETMLILFCFATLLCGIVGSARMFMQRHTLLQVLAGLANGFISVMVMMLCFG